MFLNGGAMRGGPLHYLLDGATLLSETTTQPLYRFYSIGDRCPGLAAAPPGEGVAVAGELYELPMSVLRDSLLPAEPPELELGAVALADGVDSLAMVLRRSFPGASDLIDISDVASWNRYLESQ
ncbi:gamma-glutamylcyclotransferase [Glycomyces sp. L485]|uniref:gamma-glutamylcyclotransferase n=1 Tax=Glycomyces sp. L485 TaxID=2909235 RepID=UPI001F4A7140|nr:gamma-glutamylcyclotransferase [Glycomyces sp. L485]MCH7231974.1 gamma-glutamylcyclotransferase [Glycomyces sp. L485]